MQDGIFATISADFEIQRAWGFFEIKKMIDDFIVEFWIFLFESWINVNSAAKFGVLEDFFNAERMDGYVGNRGVFRSERHAAEAMGGIFDEENVAFLTNFGDFFDFWVDNTESMLDTDSASALSEMFTYAGDRESGWINVGVNWLEKRNKNWIDGSDAGIRGGEDVARTINIKNCLVNGGHAVAGFETEIPIAGVSFCIVGDFAT